MNAAPGFIFTYLSTSQEIGWKEHLRYDLYCVEWDVKPQLNQSKNEYENHDGFYCCYTTMC